MESILSKALIVLLKRISVKSLIDNEIQSICMKAEELRNIFQPYMDNYSDTELSHILLNMSSKLRGYVEFDGFVHAVSDDINVFNAIFNFSDKVLVEQENEILCRYPKLLCWRSLVVQVSEETFVMAFMAKKDVSCGICRSNFSHKPVIGHNNMQLKAILNSGMSENHFHLMGSAPYFQLSWIQLMNNISENIMIKNVHQLENRRRNVNIKYNKSYIEEPFEDRIRQAFLIRLYLFSKLMGKRIKLKEYQISTRELTLQFEDICDAEIYAIDKELLVQKWKKKKYGILDLLFEIWGKETCDEFSRRYHRIYDFMAYLNENAILLPAQVNARDEIGIPQLLMLFVDARETIDLAQCKEFMEVETYDALWDKKTLDCVQHLLQDSYRLMLSIQELQYTVNSLKAAERLEKEDYALLLNYEWHDNTASYVALWGERNFLYYCFREICKRGCLFSYYESNLFHAYLAIKEAVRSEMVQANKYVGFENFQIHQDRKMYFLNGLDFQKHMARMAVYDTLKSQRILRLEVRISPTASAKGNYASIQFYDNAIDVKRELRDRYYYVFHFLKSMESESDNMLMIEQRHYQKRQDIEKRAYALQEFRERYPDSASRVLGIDAAAQEIGCRPEVFAVAFRSLKSHTFSYDVDGRQRLLPQLRISYHVGEDFLDIVDGLRAIEEAVLFLEMDCGDRLGHALALGVNVEDWYASKKYQLAISMQDYLDNIVWLYHAIIRYHIEGADNLKSFLKQEFSYTFQKIYGSSIFQTTMGKIVSCVKEKYGNKEVMDTVYYLYNVDHVLLSFDIHTYYKAWQLRGDAPELYKKGFYDRKVKSKYDRNSHIVNLLCPEEFSTRYVPEVAYLYYLYHYSPKVKKEGKKEIEYKVDSSLIKGISAVQKELQKEIARRGIGIETNPSSNYMIGTFKQYAKHPIINFYNRGLVSDERKLKDCPQICSSINTDDQGVFSASLENEYALMAVALEKEHDEEGNLLYNRTMIYEWLDNIRMNGNRQAFGILTDKKK